jgi:hypothetical protein
MKLYAITTSERASKGQGGNERLEIDIFIFDRSIPRYKIEITTDELLFLERGYNEPLLTRNHRDIKEQKEKGKSQKGEYKARWCKNHIHDNNKMSCVC